MHILINIDVPALPPAIEFYTRAFGLTVNRAIDDDVAELTGGHSRAANLALLENNARVAAELAVALSHIMHA